MRAAPALLEATRDLVTAFEAGDLDALDAALDARQRAFDSLREALGADGAEKERRSLSLVGETDASLLHAAGAALAAIRDELGELRDLRAAIRVLGRSSTDPRFVSRRV